ncbi:N-acetylmuramoyl-L-alanine amidase [Abyssibacter sp.]|jgi:N-acetylmuramoyl-L-alanine amidase|uniref:N-acetylmuramoyl-L-alanine amidase n=1 Tax=Abyssibacter sp. TaxID=2320200 RepID=UPI0025BAB3E3|nr:N-acetylmuramoyl-L-alanine amidase [Abyssibacter sp.]MCK5858656.1 N-acetylmuramoyl-L-alanine amidase [Abyssibacter sp.]
MRRRLGQNLTSWVFVLLGWLAASGAFAQVELQDVRVWPGPDSTRVVFDLSGAIEHKLFTLDNPSRVVIDVPNASRGAVGGADGRGIVDRVRTGQRSPDTLRLVVDLQKSVRVKSFVLPPSGRYGHRLVVDLDTGTPTITPATRATSAEAPPAPVVPMAEKPIIIAIDAGHGGEDPGARGARGTKEKDVALAISRRLAKLVNAQRNMRAVLIRDGDYYIDHRERTRLAREAQADLFVSIHADAFTDRRARGSGVYILSQRGASSEHARTLARRENESDLIGGVRLDDKDDVLASVLIDISQTAALEASFDAAERMLGEIGTINRLHQTTVQQANFLVLKAPDIPSVLVETAFISNPEEERRLSDSDFQARLAQRLLKGIQGYFSDYRPLMTVASASDAGAVEPVADAYTVQSGDTLSEIAARFSISMAALRVANGLGSDTIRIGDRLTIPSTH